MFHHLTKHRLVASATLALALASSAFAAPAGTWGLRLRGTYLDMANKSNAFTALSINFADDAVEVQSKWIPEFDISYWFNPKFSAEVVLTVPQKHEVKLAGVGSLGSFKHLPPHFMAVYHLSPDSAFQPYIGAGVNVTLISNVKLKVANVPLALDDNSIGFSGQVGFDYDFGGGKFFNFDVKKTKLASEVWAGTTALTKATLDPWIISIGFGMRF